MRIKGLETSKNLLKLTGEYVSSSESSDEEQKAGVGNSRRHSKSHEESKSAALTELPEDYDLVEEVRDEECD